MYSPRERGVAEGAFDRITAHEPALGQRIQEVLEESLFLTEARYGYRFILDWIGEAVWSQLMQHNIADMSDATAEMAIAWGIGYLINERSAGGYARQNRQREYMTDYLLPDVPIGQSYEVQMIDYASCNPDEYSCSVYLAGRTFRLGMEAVTPCVATVEITYHDDRPPEYYPLDELGRFGIGPTHAVGIVGIGKNDRDRLN